VSNIGEADGGGFALALYGLVLSGKWGLGLVGKSFDLTQYRFVLAGKWSLGLVSTN
jgi:hypothetical protein